MIRYVSVIGFIVLLVIFVIARKQELSWVSTKTYRNTFLVSSLLVLWPLAEYSFMYLLVVLVSGVTVYFWPLYQIKQEKEKRLRELRYEFPIWLRQIQILLQNNNVQHSLEKSLENAPLIMKNELANLIDVLRRDATNGDVYLDFMKDYEIYEISRAMKLLYRYHMVGASESYHQFQRMLESTGKWLRAERKNRNEDTITMLNWIGLIPLLGCTAMFVVMMFMIVLDMMKGGMI